MAWGLKIHVAQLTDITAQQFFAPLPALGVDGICVVQIQVEFPVGAVDYLQGWCYATLDGSSETWDSIGFSPFLVYPQAPIVGFHVRDVYRFRVGIERVGTTDTITSADLWYRTGALL